MFTTVWTNEKVAILKERYADTKNDELVKILGVSMRTIQRKAKELGLEKSPEMIQSVSREGLDKVCYLRLIGVRCSAPKGMRTNPAGEFKPGHKEDPIVRAIRVASLRARAESERRLVANGMRQRTKWKMKTV